MIYILSWSSRYLEQICVDISFWGPGPLAMERSTTETSPSIIGTSPLNPTLASTTLRKIGGMRVLMMGLTMCFPPCLPLSGWYVLSLRVQKGC